MTKIVSSDTDGFSEKLIRWYHRHHRDLPWRHTTDPYRIWLSEIILQQTRVAQGLPYYERFVEKYPTVQDLARADQQEVLRLWQGLGYYSRARNMHQTAQQVVQEYGGVFPDNYAGLLKLKGIGGYTAAAIASFAFGEAVPAIDGNVYRVLARIFGIRTDIQSGAARKEFTEVAMQLIPKEDAATFNQAMIEFGAIQCQPVAPDCLLCPFNEMCYAFQYGVQAELPVKAKKTKVRNRFLSYLVLEHAGRLAMRQRSAGDVWQGLYDFYLAESAEDFAEMNELPGDLLLNSLTPEAQITPPRKTYVHLLSHQKLHVRFWHIRLGESALVELPAELRYYQLAEVEELPKPILIDTFIKEYFFS